MHLAENEIIELNVEKDIIGAEIESILNADYLYLFWELIAKMTNVLINAENLSLFRGDLAPHEVTNCKGEQIGRRRPVGIS